MLMPMLLLILNDGKLFWVIVLQLDIVCLRIAKIMYALMAEHCVCKEMQLLH